MQRNNTEFVRDFNLACARQASLNLLNSKTGDQAQVNKGFLDMVFLDDDGNSESENNGEAKYAFLAEDNRALEADTTDFTDPASIMRR